MDPPLYHCLDVLANLATHIQELAQSLAPDVNLVATPLVSFQLLLSTCI